MSGKLLAAVIIVLILLVGIFLLAPNAFRGIVPDEYIPESTEEANKVPIQWVERSTAPKETVEPAVTPAAKITEENSDEFAVSEEPNF